MEDIIFPENIIDNLNIVDNIQFGRGSPPPERPSQKKEDVDIDKLGEALAASGRR